MSLTLEKGQKIDMSKGSSTRKFYVGLGWDASRQQGAQDVDLDVSAFLLNHDGVCKNDNVVFYGKLASPGGEVRHGGDNLTGDGDGDDEAIFVDLDKMGSDIGEIAVMVTIYQGEQRNQNFGGIRNAFIRICENDQNGAELARFDLEEDYSAFTGVHFGSVYLKNGEWKFNAVGDGFKNDLNGVLATYSQPA